MTKNRTAGSAKPTSKPIEAEIVNGQTYQDDQGDMSVKLPLGWVIPRVLGWTLWLIASWFVASFIISFIIVYVRQTSGVDMLANVVTSAMLQVILSIILLLLLLIPLYRRGKYAKLSKVKRRAKRMQLLGLSRLPSVKDVLPLIGGVTTYYLIAMIAMAMASLLLPDSIISQPQNVGFQATGNTAGQVALISVVLVVLTPIAEEFIFRGYLFGKYRSMISYIASALITSLVFGVAHGQINVAITTFILSMVSCRLREKTGAIWSSIGLHMMVNLVAVGLVFIMPLFK